MSSPHLSLGTALALDVARDPTRHANEVGQRRAAASVVTLRSQHESANEPVVQARSIDTSANSLWAPTEDSYTRQITILRKNKQHVTHHYPSEHDDWRTKSSSLLNYNESPIAAGYEAQAYIANELKQNDRLSAYERDIHQVAIDSIPRYGGSTRVYSPELDESITDDRGLGDPSMYPSDEVVCFLSTGNQSDNYPTPNEPSQTNHFQGSQTVAGVFYSELTSFISRSTFERMAYALIDGQVDVYTRAEYLVCVNFFMLTSVGLEEADQSGLIKKRVQILRERYRKNAFLALKVISVLNPPSLSLLQALLAGVSLLPGPLMLSDANGQSNFQT